MNFELGVKLLNFLLFMFFCLDFWEKKEKDHGI